MARNRRNDIDGSQEERTRDNVQNLPPSKGYASFDQFWGSCVKGGTPVLKESFRAHLRALGWLNKPEKWVEGARHFGIPMEK